MRVIGLNAAGGQFLPPQSEGQKSVFLPVPGLVFGINLRPSRLRVHALEYVLLYKRLALDEV